MFSYYPIRKKVKNVFTIAITPGVAGVLAAMTLTPTTSSDFTISSCSAFHYLAGTTIAAAYPCAVLVNIITINLSKSLMGSPLASGKSLTVRIVGKPGSAAGTSIAWKVDYFAAYASATDFTKRGEMTFTLTNSASAEIDSDISVPFFKFGHFAAKIYTTAIADYAPIRIKFYNAGDMVSGFNFVNVYIKTSS